MRQTRTRALAVGVPALVGAIGCLFPALVWAATAFQESSGQVVMEAEHADTLIARNGQAWNFRSSRYGYVGEGYLKALPEKNVAYTTNYLGNSPEAIYAVNFATTGTYHVWIRGFKVDGGADVVHAGIDNTVPSSGRNIDSFTYNKWAWSNGSDTLTVSTPGAHTIHIWMGEDSFEYDRVVLTIASSAPSTAWPESPRVTIGPPPDSTPPLISGIAAGSVTGSSATITWTTDEPATTQVEYGLSTGYGQATALNTTLVTSHSASLSNLTANTLYHYRVRSKDAASNEAIGADATFTTAPPPDTTPPSGTVTINSGAAATNNPTVTLALSAQDNSGTVAQMKFSNDGGPYSAPEPYAVSKAWSLSAGDGLKSVAVIFLDAAGNPSLPASATITLDTTPPQIQITSPKDGDVIIPTQ